MSEKLIVTINAGSSSLRCGVFELSGGDPKPVRSFSIRGLTGEMVLADRDLVRGTEDETALGRHRGADAAHKAALAQVFARLDPVMREQGIAAFSHRVVHGGEHFAEPVRVTDEVLTTLEALAPLAPSHQLHNLRPIREFSAHYPDAVQVACFDTAFHRTAPRVAQIYALPRELTDAGILRYGFHGLSYDYIASALRRDWPEVAGGRVIVAHLGHGVSLCAMKDGQSVATTMGLTALAGMPMGERCGAVDPGAVLHLIEDRGMSASEVREMLYTRSGLLGVSGISGEMNDLIASERPEAQEAVAYFAYRFSRWTGSLIAALGGVDGVVLTGGMGKYIAPLRARLVEAIGWAGAELDPGANAAGGPRLTTASSRLPVWMIPTDEEQILARGAAALVGAGAEGRVQRA
ncbi:acetate/propionate family kinase [Marivita sp. GX14005]|uniref:acetate/propionate family kinase n=1 Tax=Marivita sp. GX14005 TaxID=2942276 RepID=UPI0020188CCA|nr:acetate/propionate family kinase [Marivita sp. GX14005]MCL3882945.1 acetate/propionate family kinase [Marivita sp. GX14005]